MATIPIRPAAPGDLAAITSIYEHAVRHGTASFETDPPDQAEMARRYQALRAGGYPYLVVELEGTLAGYAYAGPYRARPAYRWSVEDSIYIAPQVQRRGIGRALLNGLLVEAEAAGFRQMIAVIGDLPTTPRSNCIALPAFAWSAPSTMSDTSSTAGSTAC